MLPDFSQSNKQKEIQNFLLRNINNNNDINNEKTKCLKTRVGIFWKGIFRGDFPGGNLMGGSFSGVNFPGGTFLIP